MVDEVLRKIEGGISFQNDYDKPKVSDKYVGLTIYINTNKQTQTPSTTSSSSSCFSRCRSRS